MIRFTVQGWKGMKTAYCYEQDKHAGAVICGFTKHRGKYKSRNEAPIAEPLNH
jgi:hypothetical protein